MMNKTTSSGLVAFIKRRIISDGIHKSRAIRYGVARLLNRSRSRVDTPNGPVFYFAPNAKSYMRTATVYSKEPETIAWIDSFADDDVLWDVGANIGIYSVYAASRPGARVLSFEPSPSTFAVLCKAVELNEMDDRVSAFCVALDNKKKLSFLNMQTTEAGFAGSALNEARSVAGSAFDPVYRQASIGYTIDAFIEEFDPPFPNHIKIDVDGNDHLVLEGARKTLRDKRVRTVLVEMVGGARNAASADELKRAGFQLDPASASARGNRIYRRA